MFAQLKTETVGYSGSVFRVWTSEVFKEKKNYWEKPEKPERVIPD